jgi:hypothetical protein
MIHDELPLPSGWLPLDAGRAKDLLAELRAEVIPGHLLYQVAVHAVAESDHNDDVLFRHCNDPVRFTVVHLTYCGGPEINAHHPTVELDGSWVDFLTEQQRIDDWLAGTEPATD